MIGIYHIPVPQVNVSTACGLETALCADSFDMVTCPRCRELVVVPDYLKPQQGAQHGSSVRDLPDH